MFLIFAVTTAISTPLPLHWYGQVASVRVSDYKQLLEICPLNFLKQLASVLKACFVQRVEEIKIKTQSFFFILVDFYIECIKLVS